MMADERSSLTETSSPVFGESIYYYFSSSILFARPFRKREGTGKVRRDANLTSLAAVVIAPNVCDLGSSGSVRV